MVFDLSKVFTAVNAEELKAGDKVIVASNLATLKWAIDYENKKEGYENNFKGIVEILPENEPCRFLTKAFGHNSKTSQNALAYLVERKENCTNCGNRGNSYCSCFTRDKSDDELSRTVCGNYIRLSEQKAEKPDLVSLGNGQYAERPIENCNVVNVEVSCDTCEHSVVCEKKGELCDEYIRPFNEFMKIDASCPAPKHLRPFKDTDELIKVWCEKGGKWQKRELTMPHIWVQRKGMNTQELITGFDKECMEQVKIDGVWIDTQALFNKYTFLDGSPCGVEE